MEQARSLQAAKMATLSEMSGGVAHEINNPLAIIYSIAGRLEISANKNKLEVEAVKKATASLLKASERIATIIRGPRSFARDASNDPFKADSIKSIIDTALEFCSTRFKNHNVDLRISQVPEELTVECRATEISQALLNLLSNFLS